MREITGLEIATALRSEGVPDKTVLKFLRWMSKHKPVAEAFEKFALRAVASGKQFGAKAIAERVRWEMAVEYNHDDYKMNNNWPAYLARTFEIKYPGYAGYFVFRKLKGVGLCDD